MLRKVFWLIASVILLTAAVAAFFIIESAYGDRQWDAYARVARLRGVKLTVPEILPPWPTDEENFGTAPLFSNETGGALSDDSRQWFELPPVPYTNGALRTELEKCSQIDLKEWRRPFVRAGWIADEHKLSDARVILQALERLAPDITALHEAAQRSQCRFPVDWNDPLRAPMPHLQVITNACEVLRLRGEALLADGRGSDALANLQLLLKLSQRMEREPGIKSGWVREDPLKAACNLVWSGICRGAWNEDALRVIGEELTPFDLLGHLRWSLESDRTLKNAIYDVLATSNIFDGLDIAKGGRSARLATEMFEGACVRASLQHNRIRTNRYIDDLLNQIDESRALYRHGKSQWEPTYYSTTKYSKLKELQLSLSDRLDDSYPNALRRALELHTRIQQARIACALERYRLSQGRYPDELSALVPDYLPVIPHDVCDGVPMRYRIDPFRRYVIHAIGMDQKDDGGEPPASKSARITDWVWTYPSH